jgi:hypothetical protein
MCGVPWDWSRCRAIRVTGRSGPLLVPPCPCPAHGGTRALRALACPLSACLGLPWPASPPVPCLTCPDGCMLRGPSLDVLGCPGLPPAVPCLACPDGCMLSGPLPRCLGLPLGSPARWQAWLGMLRGRAMGCHACPWPSLPARRAGLECCVAVQWMPCLPLGSPARSQAWLGMLRRLPRCLGLPLGSPARPQGWLGMLRCRAMEAMPCLDAMPARMAVGDVEWPCHACR